MIATLKKNIEKLVLAIALIVLVATAILLYLKAGEKHKELTSKSSTRKPEAVKPLERARYDAQFSELQSPFQWRDNQHRLFIPPPIYKDDKGFLQVDRKIDKNGNGIPDSWERRYELSGAASEADRDLDNDGFTNREEFSAGTDPSDPRSRPSYASKLRVVGGAEITKIELQFLGLYRPQGRPSSLLIVNVNTGTQSYVQPGDFVEKFKVIQVVRDKNDKLTGIMIQRPNEQPIEVPQGGTVTHTDPKVSFVTEFDKNPVKVGEGGKIPVRGEEFTVIKIDTVNGKVIILDAVGSEHEFRIPPSQP